MRRPALPKGHRRGSSLCRCGLRRGRPRHVLLRVLQQLLRVMPLPELLPPLPFVKAQPCALLLPLVEAYHHLG